MINRDAEIERAARAIAVSLFSHGTDAGWTTVVDEATAAITPLLERIEALEAEVAELRLPWRSVRPKEIVVTVHAGGGRGSVAPGYSTATSQPKELTTNPGNTAGPKGETK